MNNINTLNRIILLLSLVLLAPVSKAQTVTIGTQVWMTKNLDVSTFRNGDPIPEANTKEEWKKAGDNKEPAWCYYDNDSTNGKKYGKLYNWYAVNDPRGLAPLGYHIPTVTEWETLEKYLGEDVGKKIKSEPIYEINTSYVDEGGYYETKWVPCDNCSYWTEKQKENNPCTVCRNQRGKTIKTGKYIPKTKRKIEEKNNIGWNGENETGFSGLPGGYCTDDGSFRGMGYKGDWWCAKEGNYINYHRGLNYKWENLSFGSFFKEYGLSVRCIKN